jgi:oxazoline/thiazoline synthase
MHASEDTQGFCGASMKSPTFRASFVLERTGTAFIARSEDETRFLTGEVFRELIPVIDGKRRMEEIVDLLTGKFDSQRIRETLRALENAGIIADRVAGEPTEIAFWELAGADASKVMQRLPNASADVLDMEGESDGVREALSALRISVDHAAPFRIVVTRNYFHPHLAEINADALALGRPWMLVRPFGRTQWLGPIFVPGETACWRCLAYFLRVNGWTSDAAAAAGLPTTSAVIQTMAATEAAKWLLSGSNAELQGQIRALDTARLSIETHHILQRPQCPDCGNRKSKSSRVVVSDRLVSRVCGVVGELTRLPDYGPLIGYRGQLSQVFRPSVRGWVYVARQQVHGKGCTEQEARLSCFGEAVERYSVQYHNDECQTTGTLGEVPGAVDPGHLVLCSQSQYANGTRCSPKLSPYRPDERIAWARAKSLVDGGVRHLPFSHCYMGYLDGFAAADTSGCAAGETLDDATLRGLLELIERDAVALWWYNRVSRPAIDLTDCSDRIRTLVDHVQGCGRRVHVLDVSPDWRVPVSVAVSSLPDGHEITIGTAAAMDWEESAWRAVAEMAQQTALWRYRQDADLSPAAAAWMDEVTLENERYLLPAGYTNPSLKRVRQPKSASALLEECLQRAADLKLDVIMLDATRPEIGVPVARLCVPGLRPWWPRFASGRLYEVPVQLGWRSAPITERELNPLPFPA